MDDDFNNCVNYGGDGGLWCVLFKIWVRIYDYDIIFNLMKEEVKLVFGGEVVLWLE